MSVKPLNRSRRTPSLESRMGWCGLIILCALLPASLRADNLRIALGGAHTLELVLVKKGSFQQGSPPGETGRNADETMHPVTLTRDFHLGKYPVTKGQFAVFVAETGYRTEAERGTSGGFGWNGKALEQNKAYHWRNPGFPQTDAHPVCLVTFTDAQNFCQWLSRKAGREMQLPTEAEWEYARRAGTTTAWSNGNEVDRAWEVAWFKPIADHSTHPVGLKPANAWGLHMEGNVLEWCRDWYGPYPPGAVADPVQTDSRLSDKPRRILRGGSWLKEAAATRSAARHRNDPGSRNADNGFRVLSYAAPSPAPALDPPVEKADVPAAAPQVMAATPSAAPPASPAGNPPWRGSAIPAMSGFALFPAFVLGFMGLVFVLFIVKLVKVFSGTRDHLSPSRGLPFGGACAGQPIPGAYTEMAGDGYWVQLDPDYVGMALQGVCFIAGEQVIHQFICQPGPDGRQFIYTGRRPDRVTILQPSRAGSGAFTRENWIASPSDLDDSTDGPGDLDSSPTNVIAASTVISHSAQRFPPAY